MKAPLPGSLLPSGTSSAGCAGTVQLKRGLSGPGRVREGSLEA